MSTKRPNRTFTRCPRCRRENPPEGFYANGYCKPCGAAYYAELRKKNPEKIKGQHRAHYYRHQEAKQAEARAYGQRIKRMAIDQYGGVCACCGEQDLVFLVIDHVGGGGNEHRRQLGKGHSGYGFYRWLRKENYPPGYQVLCHNCNMAYAYQGFCPHRPNDPISGRDNSYRQLRDRNRHGELEG